ncbi:MAG: protein YgfX [Pseudomonadota bacterium]|nr:protein YgfX [Pseudomonadota bacterium]
MSHTLSRKYATPLHLAPDASRRLGLLLAAVHGTTLLMLPFMALPARVALVLALALLLAYIHARRSHVLRTRPDSIRELVWDSGNHWRLGLQSGTITRASLLPYVFIHPWLVILHFKRQDGRRSRLVLFADMLDPDDFRRLRVRLLIEMKQIATPAK